MRSRPSIRRVTLAVCALGALALTACADGATEPMIPTVTGTWTLSIPDIDPAEPVTGTFTLKESPT